MIPLKGRADLHEWARGNGLTDDDEELAEAWARHQISKNIYSNDKNKQSQVRRAESRLPEADQSLPWSDFEVLCAKTLFAILDSKKQTEFFFGSRRSGNSTDAMFKKRMFLEKIT